MRGGSDEARLVPYEGEEMAERRILTDKEKQGMYTMHCLGESKEAIADRYEVAVSTVYRIIREQREEHENLRGRGGCMEGIGKAVMAFIALMAMTGCTCTIAM